MRNIVVCVAVKRAMAYEATSLEIQNNSKAALKVF